jgi:hypothetical protein
MASHERDRLTERAEGLRRLRERIDDDMARAAIAAEIDNTTAPTNSPADPE